MAEIAIAPEALKEAIATALGAQAQQVALALGEVTVTVAADQYHDVMTTLRDAQGCKFEQLIDLCGVVSHLLSVSLNQRVRVRVFCADDEFPVVRSITDVWSAANWFEREAFDLYGIMFEGHADLRRILTDYGFIGHPFRKDFPISGHVEMRYDAERQRVIYEPVSIEPREVTPRIIREDNYGGLG